MVIDTLKTRVQIQQLIQASTRLKTASFTLYYKQSKREQADHHILYYATIIPKKLARRAVTRNCLKRQIRAKLNQHKHQLGSLQLLIKLTQKINLGELKSAKSNHLKTLVNEQLEQLHRQLLSVTYE